MPRRVNDTALPAFRPSLLAVPEEATAHGALVGLQ